MIYGTDVLNLCQGKLFCGKSTIEVKNITIDSRLVTKDSTYIAIKGEVNNGNHFYQDVIKKGCKFLILSEEPANLNDFDGTIIIVKDTIQTIQTLANLKRKKLSLKVIAITGSVGKTSTKDIVASVASVKYKTYKTKGNYNNHIGVPLTILGVTDEEVLIVEMGMNHLGEISLLSKIAMPDIAIITNIGSAHIGNLGSRENILKAKLEILDGLIGSVLIINYDNDMLIKVYPKLKEKYQVKTVSLSNSLADYTATNIQQDIFQSIFDIQNHTTNIKVNIGGDAFIYNALIAYATGKVLNIEDSLIKEGINKFRLTEGRLTKKMSKSGLVIIDDTYNASYDSMTSSLELLGKVKNMRKVAILGDMLELGNYTKEFHEKVGKEVVNNNIDLLITVGEKSLLIASSALENKFQKEKIHSFKTNEDCINHIKPLLEKNDIILVKGSNGIHLNRVVNYLLDI